MKGCESRTVHKLANKQATRLTADKYAWLFLRNAVGYGFEYVNCHNHASRMQMMSFLYKFRRGSFDLLYLHQLTDGVCILDKLMSRPSFYKTNSSPFR